MNASLVEMALAIGIAGLIFASAIVPTTQSAIAYQQAEAELRQATAQATAATRAEQVAGSIWRDADPPGGHATLERARAVRLQVGDWKLRENGGSLEQQSKSTAWAAIAEPVQNLSFKYLLNDGSWATSVNKAQLGDVLAVRYSWADPDSGRTYDGRVIAPDRAFSAGLLKLPQPDTAQPYQRKDYERTLTFSLGSWK
jgi:hypothetical protein